MKKLVKISGARIAVLAASLIGAGVTLFAAAAVQQNYRQSADDPQVQLASDAAARLSAGASANSVIPSSMIDMHASLAPFVMVVDYDSHVPATSGKLDGQTVLPPAATLTPDHRFTWQPDSTTRLAAVIEQFNGGYVLAARNLREVERREDNLRLMAALTLAGIAVVGITAWTVIREY